MYTCPSWPEPPVTIATRSCEVEERIRVHAATARFAFQTASQNSRTQPCPPARVSTMPASGITSAHASAGTTGSPTDREALGVVDVVAEVRRLAERHAAPFELLAEDRQLVLDSPDALDADLPRTRGNGVVRLRGEDEVVDADLVEPSEPGRVSTEARDALLAAIVRPHAVVGEDAVEVEDDEADLAQRRHASRAATGSATGSTSSLATCLLGGERPREPPPEQVVELVRREAAVGRGSRREVVRRQDVSDRKVAGGHELLAHLLQGPRFARERALHAVADGVGDAVQVADEAPHALGHEREGVVGALPGVVQGEVLLDDARAQHVADE